MRQLRRMCRDGVPFVKGVAAVLALGLLGCFGFAEARPAASSAQPDRQEASIERHVTPRRQEEAIEGRVMQRGPVSLREAVAMAMRRYEGRVVRAETRTRNGRRVHEIRIIDDEGRVRTVRVDAESGEFR